MWSAICPVSAVAALGGACSRPSAALRRLLTGKARQQTFSSAGPPRPPSTGCPRWSPACLRLPGHWGDTEPRRGSIWPFPAAARPLPGCCGPVAVRLLHPHCPSDCKGFPTGSVLAANPRHFPETMQGSAEVLLSGALVGSRGAGTGVLRGRPSATPWDRKGPQPLVAVSSRLTSVGTTPSHMSIWEKFSAPPACWVQAGLTCPAALRPPVRESPVWRPGWCSAAALGGSALRVRRALTGTGGWAGGAVTAGRRVTDRGRVGRGWQMWQEAQAAFPEKPTRLPG